MAKTALKPNWQVERVRILKRLVHWLDIESAKGKRVNRLIRRYSRRWNGRPFKRDPKRKLRLSAGTLRKIFYTWQKTPTPAVFVLHYVPNSRAFIPRAFLTEVLRRCQSPDALSIGSVLRVMDAEWQAGRRVPGLGTWQTYAKRHGLKSEGRRLPIPLPHRRSVYRHTAGIDFQRRKAILKNIAALETEIRGISREIQQRSNALRK